MKAVYIFETFLLHFELTYWNWTQACHHGACDCTCTPWHTPGLLYMCDLSQASVEHSRKEEKKIKLNTLSF